jgi:Phosphatidylserine decarboxylase
MVPARSRRGDCRGVVLYPVVGGPPRWPARFHPLVFSRSGPVHSRRIGPHCFAGRRTVTDIVELEEAELIKRRVRRVGIFLSVFDVHVNRAPADCRVVYTAEFEGTYHDARSPAASTHNTARTWGFECPDGVLLVVRQITGAIARRIVPWARPDQQLARGERFGMIRFGSRTEICLPLEAEVLVQVGDQVKAGSTIVARLALAAQTARPVGDPSAAR